MEYTDSGRIETTYFGDLQAAISAQTLQHKIFDQL
jgi:hypothetical protein